jgi:hypothetical protein
MDIPKLTSGSSVGVTAMSAFSPVLRHCAEQYEEPQRPAPEHKGRPTMRATTLSMTEHLVPSACATNCGGSLGAAVSTIARSPRCCAKSKPI